MVHSILLPEAARTILSLYIKLIWKVGKAMLGFVKEDVCGQNIIRGKRFRIPFLSMSEKTSQSRHIIDIIVVSFGVVVVSPTSCYLPYLGMVCILISCIQKFNLEL